VAADADGNVIITGPFTGSVGFGKNTLMSGGGNDVYVAKFGTDGALQWDHAFGGASDQRGQAVAAGPDGGVVIAGTFSGSVNFGGGPLTSAGYANVYIAKLDATGTHVFSKSYGDDNLQDVASVAVDTCGDVLATGSFFGTLDFGGGPLTAVGLGDMYVAKLGPKGEYVWAKSYGDDLDQFGMAVTVSPLGHVYVAGYFDGKVDMGKEIQTKEAYDAIVARFEP
jgi:hypothetical protein